MITNVIFLYLEQMEELNKSISHVKHIFQILHKMQILQYVSMLWSFSMSMWKRGINVSGADITSLYSSQLVSPDRREPGPLLSPEPRWPANTFSWLSSLEGAKTKENMTMIQSHVCTLAKGISTEVWNEPNHLSCNQDFTAFQLPHFIYSKNGAEKQSALLSGVPKKVNA